MVMSSNKKWNCSIVLFIEYTSADQSIAHRIWITVWCRPAIFQITFLILSNTTWDTNTSTTIGNTCNHSPIITKPGSSQKTAKWNYTQSDITCLTYPQKNRVWKMFRDVQSGGEHCPSLPLGHKPECDAGVALTACQLPSQSLCKWNKQVWFTSSVVWLCWWWWWLAYLLIALVDIFSFYILVLVL